MAAPAHADEAFAPRVVACGNRDGPRAVGCPVDRERLRQHFFVADVARPVRIVGVGEGRETQTHVLIVERAVAEIVCAVTFENQRSGAKRSRRV